MNPTDPELNLLVSIYINLAYLRGFNKSEDPKLEEDAIAPVMALIASYTENEVLASRAKMAKAILIGGGELTAYTKEYLQNIIERKR